MNAEGRFPLSCDGWRMGDHFGDITEMVAIRVVPANLPPAESMEKLESKRRKEPKAPKRLPSETHLTGDSEGLGEMCGVEPRFKERQECD